MGEGGSAEGGGEDKKVLGGVGLQEDKMSLRTHPKTNRPKLGNNLSGLSTTTTATTGDNQLPAG